MSQTRPRLTEFASQNVPLWIPFHDPCRLYTDEHDVEVHGHGTHPFRGFSGTLYDRVQRRWYQLETDSKPMNEEPELWLKNTLLMHINGQHSFNVITISNGQTSFSLRPKVGRPVRPPLVLYSSFPTANYGDVVRKKYYDLSVDTCMWNGAKYMYKQIEFDEDIPRLQREIRCREKLQQFTRPDSISNRHGVCPISAIVVDETSPRLCGLLLPQAGTPLVRLQIGQLQVSHLISLLETLKCLQAVEIVHGDICKRNVCIDGLSIRLIDFGEVAPYYTNDIVATGELFRTIDEVLPMQERGKVYQAARILTEQEDLDVALSILESKD